jgi:CheY-like chemotaxis protein
MASLERRPRILLVDDDGSFRDSLGEALEEAGFTVLRADNGQTALQALDLQGIPDVILLDLLMPVMNGWQFCLAKKAARPHQGEGGLLRGPDPAPGPS